MRNIVLGCIAFAISCGCVDHGERPPYEPSGFPSSETVAFRIDGFKPDSAWICGISGFCHENRQRLTATAYGDSAFAIEIPIPDKRSKIITVEETDSSKVEQHTIRSVLTIDGREYAWDCGMQIHIFYEYLMSARWRANSTEWAGERASMRKRFAYPSEVLLRRDADGRLRASQSVTGKRTTNF